MTHRTVIPVSAQFIGLDVGDGKTHLCCVDGDRQVVERKRFSTTRESFEREFSERAPTKVVLEVGSQSPWISALLRELGHDVLVADARRVAALIRHERKTDRRDAEALARLLVGVPEMLGKVHHRGRQAQADLAVIRTRDQLVSTRTRLIQCVRGIAKSFGLQLPACSPSAFHRRVREVVPSDLEPALMPVIEQLATLEPTIRRLDRRIEDLAQERYPEANRLRQVRGVGALTALSFVLTLDDPTRFEKSRMVGAWLGLAPKVAASGDRDPQLGISKTGSVHMRRLLVQSAHYILGPFGHDCDLRRHGERISQRGGKSAKKRAAVAVARKLAVLMHRLWVSKCDYVPIRSQPT
ncbi:MAG: IS110 family transposase [Planctomycetota bacterium]